MMDKQGGLRAVVAVIVIAALGALPACSSGHGPFVWAEEYPVTTPRAADGYLIGVGDLLVVQVYDNDKISTRGRVRSDGRLSMPLVDDLDVAQKPPKQVAREIERRLRDASLVLDPHVNVIVEEVQPVKVAVLGAVARSGTYTLEPGSGVAEALASAGGLTEFAHRDQIYVLRRNPTLTRIRFTFNSLTETGRAATFRLQTGDLIVAD
jgi:polysaccharide export outer membrane protein